MNNSVHHFFFLNCLAKQMGSFKFHSCIKSPEKGLIKGRQNLEGNFMTLLSFMFMWINKICYCQFSFLLVPGGWLAAKRRSILLNFFLSKSIGSKAITCFSLSKAFSVVLCSSFNVKQPSRHDETANTAASTLASSAATRLAVTSCFSSFIFH